MKLYRKTSPPYMKLTQLFVEFFNSEKAGGILLLLATVVSLLLANFFLKDAYLSFWQVKFAGHTLVHWINDGLMTLFFLLIGLELEREIYEGELSEFKNAILPIIAALGGMLVPAGIFLAFNHGMPTQDGAGIPMATDIAFAIGILSLLGNRVPSTLKILLTAIAVIDDLGAIIVIALFYAGNLNLINLFIALAVFGFLFVLRQFKVCNVWPYLIGGLVMWYFMLNSGIHPTISGVLLAFAIPFGKTLKSSPSYKVQHALHKPVAFVILPVFALANTGIIIGNDWYQDLASPNSLGILAGLIAGKPLGILGFSFIAVMLGICALPEGLKWKQLFGIGLLTGIGFTMSIFITLLAFTDPGLITQSKISIFLASVISGTLGLVWLRVVLKERQTNQ